MKEEKSVLFKGIKEGIVVLLDKEASFLVICEQLEQKIMDAKKFFGGAKCNVFLDGRDMSEEEEKKIADIISNKINLDASYIKRLVKTEKVEKLEKAEESKETKENDMKISLNNVFKDGFGENNTKFYKGTLRSGQKIGYNGSMVILGDVNPGAEVTATGNIIVLGTLKGIVHAGCSGDTAYVVALKMTPVQLRISDIIGRAEDKKNKKNDSPEIAYIHENMIYVEPIDQKLFANI